MALCFGTSGISTSTLRSGSDTSQNWSSERGLSICVHNATILAILSSRVFHIFALIILLSVSYRHLLDYLHHSASKNLNIRGPRLPNLFLGAIRQIRLSRDPKLVYSSWAREYGSVYRVPTALGAQTVIVCDIKAAAHVFAKDTLVYVKTPGLRGVIEKLVGRGVLWAEGESHRRQRKVLTPAFGPGAIKDLTGTLYDCAYRLKAAWDRIIDSAEEANGQVEIEMHKWMTKLSLDVIGRAAFGHDFHSLEGQHSDIEEALSFFNTSTPSKLGILIYVASIFVPQLGKLPTKRNRMFRKLSDATRDIMQDLVDKRKNGQTNEVDEVGKSVIELLIDEEVKTGSDTQMSEKKEEIIAQMKAILIAGSDPPGLTMVWTLIELARHPLIQDRLREELTSRGNSGKELTYEELQISFPFLDAVISEVLRLHPSIGETPRVAAEDDILHLNEPILDAASKLTDTIFIPKGTKVTVPSHYLNISEAMWGADATVFRPDRWLALKELEPIADGDDTKISARPRIWSFGEGPRVCVGKAFALTQLKIVLSVLIREFVFELPQGPETPIDVHFSLTSRPKIGGLEGANFPFIVRRVR